MGLASRISPKKPALERRHREGRHPALWCDSDYPLREIAEARRLGEKVGEPGRPTGEAGPQEDEAECISHQRSRPSRVVVRQELRFVGRHIHIHRALTLAGFTGQTEVERFFDGVVPPAGADGIALQHLEQQPCSSSRRVPLLAGDHVARAHRAHADLAAASHADAAERRLREVMLVVRKAKLRLHLGRRIAGQTEVGVQGIGID